MATAVPPPTRTEIISLFRSLLRSAREFSDYNIREYTKRRTIDSFRDNKTLSDPSSIAAAFTDGKSQLQVAKRQAVVYSLYAPKVKSIMDIKP
ncbi:LYR motif-containing protein 4-like [Cynara cardunculus var. scolymus]|uniref:Complex 1 LYR protein n=1 Tax=Cynara cardunculus var. scolymus TaxID=59895 RepID=A0A118JYZ0_CYNCS|nr:LYR motif-containing protein 4-like [Cynara cardunculus var. scolymus]KVH99264.1 Complex 1 LYR protein [Cynara cardunculus var. scolymus]